MLFLLLVFLSSSDAVTLTGLSEYAVPGSEFTLTCDVPEEAAQVQLYRRPGVAAAQVFQWVIQPQTGDHGSVWYCQRTNARLPAVDRLVHSPDYTLNVAGGPRTVTLSPPDITYTRTEGNTLPDITCTADCIPGCAFVWTKPDNTNFTASAVLSLGQLDRSEQGTYRCTVGNIYGSSTISAVVTIQFPPEIDSLEYNQGDADVTEDGSKTLICKVESVPKSTITWYYKNNDTNLFTAADVLESSYTLTTAGCLDTGLYTCSARNSVSNTAVTKDIRINVLCSPRLDPRLFTVRKMLLATHDNLIMNAMFLSNPEPSSFTWTFQYSSHNSFTELNDGTDNFVIHNTHFSSSLSTLSVGTRTNIKEAWFGVYNVTARNSEGYGTLTFTVADKECPCSTDSMYVTGVTLICTSILTLLLTVGLGIFISRNGRLPCIKGQHLKQREFQNVQLSERAVTPNEEEDER
ncbi:hemicentin-1-like isoform X2 [Mizuhopecten yessoensis]|uniref:hemicentin-1-like isoform X2 n=1 Tax=Mizuhopecten yessoensis TaxID=6573 RepID=UPI000B45EBBA|nr:hemicentin-1-like isoform X2 [Mizuhopecten yessoensis]